MNYRFEIVKRGKTERGANYFSLNVETAQDIWEEAVYFGNTVPKKVTNILRHTSTSGKEYTTVEIQPHTSRDSKTGRFTSFKRCHA